MKFQYIVLIITTLQAVDSGSSVATLCSPNACLFPNQNHGLHRNERTIQTDANVKSSHPTPVSLTIDGRDPREALIFAPQRNRQKLMFAHIVDNNVDRDSMVDNGSEKVAKQPEFLRGINLESRQMPHNTHMSPVRTQKSRNPDRVVSGAADSMPTPDLPRHPLPASTKPLSEKKDCVVMGRAGHCFPYYPIQNVYNCFSQAGVVAMDAVRCTWLRACCVHNFF